MCPVAQRNYRQNATGVDRFRLQTGPRSACSEQSHFAGNMRLCLGTHWVCLKIGDPQNWWFLFCVPLTWANPPCHKRERVGVPQFHLSSLPHKRENGTINGISDGSPPSPKSIFKGWGCPKRLPSPRPSITFRIFAQKRCEISFQSNRAHRMFRARDVMYLPAEAPKISLEERGSIDRGFWWEFPC